MVPWFSPRVLAATIIVAAGTIACRGQASSQPAAQPAWIATTTTRIKPEMRQQFESSIKQVMAAYRKGGAAWFLTFQTIAGDTTEYTTIVPLMKFADLDRSPLPATVPGANTWERLSSSIAACYTSQTVQYATPVTSLEINKPDLATGSYWIETRSQVLPSKMDDYLDWLRSQYRPALDTTDVAGFRVSIVVFGSAGNEVVSMRMLKNLSEIDEGSILSRALGNDAARVVAANGAALVLANSTRILRARPDLSYSTSH